MAFHKFSKTKSFHVEYCGCTAAALLLNEQSIRNAINSVRQVKAKREFVKTILYIVRDGVKIIYGNDDAYATHVPSSMIGGAASAKSSRNTIGVVYISPLTGNHYPAFVHVYRCDSTRTARKLLHLFRAFNYNETNRSKILQLEKKLIDQNLLNLNHYDNLQAKSESSKTATLDSNKTNTNLSSSSTNSSSRLEKTYALKSVTEEFQKKLDSHQPLLFPPKDYDTVRAAHGNIQRAQGWKSTEPTIVGYTSIDPDNNSQAHKKVLSNHNPSNGHATKDEIKRRELNNSGINRNPIQRHFTQKSDTTIDPVETVSLAFEFLKDETGSIVTDNDDNIEYRETEQQDKQPVFRFLPPPINAITKKIFTRTNNYELSNNLLKSTPTLDNELNAYYQNARHQRHRMPYEHRTRSETNLLCDQQPRMHLSPRYESRLVNGSGAPISTNPLWTAASPIMIGSQPNLLSYQGSIALPTYYHHHRRPSSPLMEQRIASAPLQHPLYAGYPNNNSVIMARIQENSHTKPKLPPPPPPVSHLNRKEIGSSSQYLDTNEFILRPSDGNERSSNNSPYSNRPSTRASRDYRPHSVNITGHDSSKLDVYY